MATRTASTASKGNGMVGDYDRLRRRRRTICPSIQRAAEKSSSRELGFRYRGFSETPICATTHSWKPAKPRSYSTGPPWEICGS